MNASLFISRRLRFRNSIAMTAIAISYLVMIIAVAVSSGFRREIRNELSGISGDVQLTPPNLNVLDTSRPVESDASYIPELQNVDGVEAIIPVVYRAGIIKQDDNIHGVLFKGLPADDARVSRSDSLSLSVSIPSRLSEITGLSLGDRMTAYFIGEKINVRRFNVAGVYESLVEADDKIVVYAAAEDLQRLEGWKFNQVSAIEIILDDNHKSEEAILMAAQEIGAKVNAYSAESDAPVVATSSVSRYSQLFDWLSLIDLNVLVILALMTVVAGFNMISSLLIFLFENISTIGLLKALGMTDRGISTAFLARSSVLVLKGMAIGNVLAFLFCIIQDRTHLLKLDPANYFVSFVPVDVNVPTVLVADAVSFAVIMLLLLVPTLFISKVDPARTVRVR
jgi:lipoprotein-releasing system permease protein